jgi:hypothetical protein
MSHTQSTAAAARYVQFTGYDPDDHEYMIWGVEVYFNGTAPAILAEVRHHISASASTKQNALRTAINNHLIATEPGVVLSNAVIQVSGQPV